MRLRKRIHTESRNFHFEAYSAEGVQSNYIWNNSGENLPHEISVIFRQTACGGYFMRHAAIAILLLASAALHGEIATPPPPEKTTVSATLDVPHRPGQNLIWCSTFQLAWNAMGLERVKEALRLEGTPALERALNASTVNVWEVDAPSVYVKTVSWGSR
jgi:hypothetical protein